jgi:hypothetical protein
MDALIVFGYGPISSLKNRPVNTVALPSRDSFAARDRCLGESVQTRDQRPPVQHRPVPAHPGTAPGQPSGAVTGITPAGALSPGTMITLYQAIALPAGLGHPLATTHQASPGRHPLSARVMTFAVSGCFRREMAGVSWSVTSHTARYCGQAIPRSSAHYRSLLLAYHLVTSRSAGRVTAAAAASGHAAGRIDERPGRAGPAAAVSPRPAPGRAACHSCNVLARGPYRRS